MRIPGLLPQRGPAVLSDAPDNPLAYHGLSLGLYARAVHLLGPGRRAGGPAGAAAGRLGGGADRWPRTAASPTSGARRRRPGRRRAPPTPRRTRRALPGSTRAVAAVARTVAYRSLERLERAYPIGRGGVAIVPAIGAGAEARLARPRRLCRRAVDGRAGADAAQLDARAAPARALGGPAAGRLPARRDGQPGTRAHWRSCGAARPGSPSRSRAAAAIATAATCATTRG